MIIFGHEFNKPHHARRKQGMVQRNSDTRDNNYTYPLCGGKAKPVKGVKCHKPIIKGDIKSEAKTVGITEKRFPLAGEKRKEVQRKSRKGEYKGIIAPELHRIYYSRCKTGKGGMLFDKINQGHSAFFLFPLQRIQKLHIRLQRNICV